MEPYQFILEFILGLVGLFFGIVMICMPFWVYAILKEIKALREELSNRHTQAPKVDGRQIEVAENTEAMVRIMAGVSTPEQEKERYGTVLFMRQERETAEMKRRRLAELATQ